MSPPADHRPACPRDTAPARSDSPSHVAASPAGPPINPRPRPQFFVVACPPSCGPRSLPCADPAQSQTPRYQNGIARRTQSPACPCSRCSRIWLSAAPPRSRTSRMYVSMCSSYCHILDSISNGYMLPSLMPSPLPSRAPLPSMNRTEHDAASDLSNERRRVAGSLVPTRAPPVLSA